MDTQMAPLRVETRSNSYMKKTYFLLVSIFLVFITNTSFAVTEEDDYFTVLCEEEQSTGFNWEDGGWVRTKFITSKIIIKKVKWDEKYVFCTEQEIKNRTEYEDLKWVYGCYESKRFGEEWSSYPRYAVKVCSEWWEEINDEFVLQSVKCDDSPQEINFAPNGYFHKSYFHSNLSSKPKDDYKDSLYVSVGKCSTL